MRRGLALLSLVWFILPCTVHGQSTLNFPKAFSPAELATTGFAIVNPGPASASATFTLRSAAGASLSSVSETIPGGGQLARLGTELFPGTAGAGWVQVASAASGLTGFFLSGDFSTFTDGAVPAASSSDLVLPLVTEATEISVANVSANAAELTLSLRGPDGGELSSFPANVAGMGVLQGQASTLFPGVALEQPTHIEISGGVSISASAVVTDFLVSPAIGVVNAVPASSMRTELDFSHVISGPLGASVWLTSVGVTNLSSSSNPVSITFTPATGSPTTVSRTLAPNGSLRESAESLFSFPQEFQDGWVQVTGAAPVTGFVAYADTAAGAMAIVPVPAEALTNMIFAHVAQAENWLTGVALLNTSNTAANVEVFALDPAGGLIGGAQDSPAAAFTLAPNAKIARLINEWIPAADSNGGFVFVRTTNGVPLYGMELFFLLNGGNVSLLSNVSPGALADGITYTPPAPAAPLSLTSISPATAARGDAVTLTGTGFETGDTVVFSASGGTANVGAVFGSSTSLTATVPSTAISGPVFVRSGTTASSSLILDVTQSATDLIETPVTVSAGQTTTVVDIYVPEGAGSTTLNVTAIGSGDRFEGIGGSASTVMLSRGETTDLRIVGTGMSESAGSTLSVTGTGITLSDVVFTETSLFIQISVSENAELGPRSVIMTNANLDTSVLSGGIEIE